MNRNEKLLPIKRRINGFFQSQLRHLAQTVIYKKNELVGNLANWNKSDGAPFNPQVDLKYTTIDLAIPRYRILSDQETSELGDQIQSQNESTILDSIKISAHSITSILLIDKYEVLDLVTDMKGASQFFEKFHHNIFIYALYPFEKAIEIELEPKQNEFYFGIILWEIARVYAEVFHTKWKEAGVYGHRLNDLVFEEISFFEGKNKAVLELGS